MSTSFWFTLGAILVIAEFFVPGFIIIFFGVGALITAFLCHVFNLNAFWQSLSFIIASLATLFALRRLLMPNSYEGKRNEGEQSEDYIGHVVTVVEDVSPLGGKVELNGSNWCAIAESTIPVGKKVRVIARNGLTLTVAE